MSSHHKVVDVDCSDGDKLDSMEKSNIFISSSGTIKKDWLSVEEVSARRKADWTIIPLLTLGLTVFQLDRMNLSSALTGGFQRDVHTTQEQVNVGNFLMFAGIIVLELPSNLMLMKLGPRIWLSSQVILFGLVATLQTLLRNPEGFYITRLILGFCEAGYIPGSLYILSTWYIQNELGLRIGIFFCGMFGGMSLSPLLATAILKLDSHEGMAGWQWIFLIEGLLTVLVGIVIFIFIPHSPAKVSSITGLNLQKFSQRDEYILQQRLKMEGRLIRSHVSIATVYRTLSYWKRWPHFLATALVFGTWSPLTTYTPSIFVSLGFEKSIASALTSIGSALTLAVTISVGAVSDYMGSRGMWVAIPIALYLIALVLLRTIQPHVGTWGRFGLWTTVNAFAVGYHAQQNTWLQANCGSLEERCISVSLWVMSAMTGLMCGTQIFQEKDAPEGYSTGIEAMIGMVSCGLLVVALQGLIYATHNRQIQRGSKEGSFHIL